MEEAADTLVIRNIRVSRKLFEHRSLRRCGGGAACSAKCCQGGVYIELSQAARIKTRASEVRRFLREDRRKEAEWFDAETEWDHDHPDGGMLTSTRVLPDTLHPAGRSCIFLNENFHCAIQAASIASGESPWELKPLYCSLFPLVFEKGILTLDEDSLRWPLKLGCCVEAPTPAPLYALLRVELEFILGGEGYAELVQVAKESIVPPVA